MRLAFPKNGAFEPGTSESLLMAGETTPTGRMPINPSPAALFPLVRQQPPWAYSRLPS